MGVRDLDDTNHRPISLPALSCEQPRSHARILALMIQMISERHKCNVEQSDPQRRGYYEGRVDLLGGEPAPMLTGNGPLTRRGRKEGNADVEPIQIMPFRRSRAAADPAGSGSHHHRALARHERRTQRARRRARRQVQQVAERVCPQARPQGRLRRRRQQHDRGLPCEAASRHRAGERAWVSDHAFVGRDPSCDRADGQKPATRSTGRTSSRPSQPTSPRTG